MATQSLKNKYYKATIWSHMPTEVQISGDVIQGCVLWPWAGWFLASWLATYTYFEKDCLKKYARDNPKR